MDKIVALAKRRGFIYPSSEIYGGLANTWDWGPYGTLLKKNISDLWWEKFVLQRDDIVSLDASIFLNPKAWEASGHVSQFTDVLIDCRDCHYRTRADHLVASTMAEGEVAGMSPQELEETIAKNKIKCPKCSHANWTKVRKFNLLFETSIGILEESKSTTYLRGEIAQGIFLNYKNILDTMRIKVPFGIAQQGKSFRNEITLGKFVHRTLEFDLAEIEYFINKENWKDFFFLWQNEMHEFALATGLNKEKLRWREHVEKERSHYSEKTSDLEYQYPFGWAELFGLSYRGDYDLKNHMLKSGSDLNYKDPISHEKYIPHVVEPSFGLSRLVGAILADSYMEDEVKGETRIFLKLKNSIAPVKAAIFPLQKDIKLKSVAWKVYRELRKIFVVEFDDAGNIGKMYRRQDEIGTPFCITFDYQSLEDDTVTIRDRDTMRQERIAVSNLKKYLQESLK